MRALRPACRDPKCRGRQPCPRHPIARQPARFYSTYAWTKKSKGLIASRGHVCEIDGEGPRPNDPLVAGHKITRRAGGSDEESNLQVVHRSENSRKAALSEGRWG